MDKIILEDIHSLAEHIARLKAQLPHLTVAIDGRCAAGKSTAAAMLGKTLGAPIVHTDDFFLPANMRTSERLREPGGNLDRERFMREVLPHVNSGKYFEYRRYDCKSGTFEKPLGIAATDIIIVEGAYSMHPSFGDYADLCVFFDIEHEAQCERILKRNGAAALEIFKNKWIPLEESYFMSTHTNERADMIYKSKAVI